MPAASQPTSRTLTQQEANYRPATGTRQCGNCSMFHNFSLRCDLVQGKIRSDYTCDHWDPK